MPACENTYPRSHFLPSGIMTVVIALREDVVFAGLKSCCMVIPGRSLVWRPDCSDLCPKIGVTGDEVVRGHSCNGSLEQLGISITADFMGLQTIFLIDIAIVLMRSSTQDCLRKPPPGYPCRWWTLEVLQVGILTKPNSCEVPSKKEGKVEHNLRAGNVLCHGEL